MSVETVPGGRVQFSAAVRENDMKGDTRPILIPQPQQATFRRGWLALPRNLVVTLAGGSELKDEHAAHVVRGELWSILGGERPTALHIDRRRKQQWLRVAPKGARAQAPTGPRRLRKEGYELRVTPRSIEVVAADSAGLLHGVMTLRQLSAGGRRIPCVTIRDWPELALRGIHYDLKGVMPKYGALMESLAELSRLKLNCILLEYEDKFPWSKESGLASPLALKESALRRFLAEARARHIRVIPLVQSLGHAEMALRHRKYARLREVRDNFYQYCPSNRASVELVKRLIEEVAEFHPEEPFFHVGADEAWLLGTCPRCARAARRVGKNGLYLTHMKPVWQHVLSLGKRPIMWDDMLRRFTLTELKQVPRDVVLMYWLYNRFEPDVAANFPHLPRYLEQGFDVLGASAAKGADGRFANLPNVDRRLRNVFAWARVARRHQLTGVVSTAWSRYTYLLAPCEPFETAWLSLAGSAEAYWTARPPSPDAFVRKFLRLDGGAEDDELAELILRPGRPGYAKLAEVLRARAASGGRRPNYWLLLSALYELEAWIGHCQEVEKQVVHQLPLFEAGRLPPTSRNQLRQRVRRSLAQVGALKTLLSKELRKTLRRAEVEEFVASRLDGYEVVLEALADVIG